MSDNSPRLETLDHLRNFVYQFLCDFIQLEPGEFRMTEQILTRGGQPCGTVFCLHGPRRMQLTAIWETDQNTILFYNSGGERIHRVRLQGAPNLSLVPA